MRIAVHLNQFDGRGTGKAAYDYGNELRNQFGHDVIFVTSARSANPTLPKISQEFRAILYDGSLGKPKDNRHVRNLLSRIVDDEKIDFMYQMKYGTNDFIAPGNCKTGIHGVFDMSEPHGSVYAGISHYIAAKFGRTAFVPYIVRKFAPSEDFKARLGIPPGATVIGRHGGHETFDIPFVHNAIKTILSQRDDMYFLFVATDRFCDHDRVKFVPWMETGQDIFNFIYACDAMLHARLVGETFGLAVAEFSIANKPVITWTGRGQPNHDSCHLEVLGDRALVCDAYDDLLELLRKFDRRRVADTDWDRYSSSFNKRDVMRKFNAVFLA
jgi:hypothetical protein